MKKLATLIAFSLLLNINGLLSQSFYILGGIGLHPKSPTWPVTCITCCSYCPQDVAFDKIVKYTSSPGYSIFAGIGKEIRIRDNWSFTLNGRFQYLKIPSAEQYWVQERHLDKELLTEGKTKYNLENLHLQAALSLQRKINIGKLEMEVFGGGFGRLRLYESLFLHASETHYYTDMISGLAVNEQTGEVYGVVVSKRKLAPPLKHFYSGKPNGNIYRPLHYGLLAGFNINLLSSSKGLLKGQLTFTHDLNTLFRHDFERPNYHLNSGTIGIIYYPLKSQKSEKDIDIIKDQPTLMVEAENPEDSLNYLPAYKPNRKIPKPGFNGGISQQDLFFTSFNFGYLSNKKFGFDLSYRVFPIRPSAASSFFIGPVYQIANTRLFAKSGIEFLFLDDGFVDDEERAIGSLTLLFMGGKSLIPFSKGMGLQLDFGAYMFLDEPITFFPGVGVGLIFGRFGPKA